MTLDEFLSRHTSRQLTEIVARDRLDPYDTAGRMELGLAKIAALLFNANRDSNRSEAMSVADVMPEWGQVYRDRFDTKRIEQQLETLTTEEAVRRVKAGFARYRKTNAKQP